MCFFKQRLNDVLVSHVETFRLVLTSKILRSEYCVSW
jgi:hypothetical protein